MAGKKYFVKDLQEGQQVHDVFLVSRKTLAETKTGKSYLAMTLMDKTGEIEARIWDNAEGFDGQAAAGNYVLIKGVVKSFRDKMQLGVVFLEQLDAAKTNPRDFMPTGKRSVSEMEAELDAVISSVRQGGLRDLLAKIFSGATRQQFCVAPAAKKMHHAYLGGLLEHTLSVTQLAIKTAGHYPGIDRDMLITGALLHDLAKIREFSYASPPFDYTDQGRLMGHLVIGVDMVRQAAVGIDSLAPEQLDQVCHLIISHHGRHEFGAPVLPMTQEALLLHHLDDMDAKINYTDQLREQVTGPGCQWSEYQRPLERFLYLRPLDEHSGEQKTEPPPPPAAEPVKRGKMDQAELLQRQQRLF